jgi:hypothetical protein
MARWSGFGKFVRMERCPIVSDRAFRLLRLASLAMFGLTLVLSASLTPLFTDEISSQIPNGRWVRDGYLLSNNLAACGIEASERPAAMFSYPFLMMESAIHELIGQPGWIRLRSLTMLFAWLFMMSRLLPKSVRLEGVERASLWALGAAFLSIGVLPVMLVFARPEIYLLFGLSLCLMLPLMPGSAGERSPASQIRLALLWLFLSALMFTYHFKAVFFLPLIWASVWMTLADRRIRLAALALVSLIAFLGVRTWSSRLVGCADPGVMSFISAHMLPLTALIAQPAVLFRTITARLIDLPTISPHPYFGNALVRQVYEAEWLYHPDSPLLRYLVNGIALAAFGALFACLAVSFANAMSSLARHRTLERRQILFLCALAGFASLSFMQGTKHYYETILVLPVLGLTALICPPRLPASWLAYALPSPRSGQKALAVILSSAIVSQLALCALYAPMASLTLSGKVIYEKQHFSLSAYKYAAVTQEVNEAAKLCGIDLGQEQSHMVIDDMTYLSLRKSVYQPLHGLFLYYWWFDPKKRRDVTMAPYSPAGAILSCNHVFPEFKGKEKRAGGICCISGADMAPPK